VSAGAPQRDVLGLPRADLASALAPWIDRPYRVEQVYRAVYERGAPTFEAITGLGLTLRRQLAERFRIGLPAIDARHVSRDGTTKYLFRLPDGATVEAVDIPDARRRTFCISSQAGCAMGCRFCVTGFWGAGRNLSAGEIVGQVLGIAGGLGAAKGSAPGGARSRASRTQLPAPARPTNLVFMGMGEPLLNLDAVRPAIEVLGEWISPRRITVSTVGVVPGIRELAGWPRRPNLAVSLHAPDDERRSALMPVNRSYPLAELMAALREFPLEPGRRLTFEYLLIAGTNAALADADALARLLGAARLREVSKVNLIPVNPDAVLGAAMVPPDPDVVTAFRDRLRARGLVATVRRRRGDDVSAACGQLRASGRDPRGFRRSNLSW
jgi:23S rRNA (adenine2503-C2)-methyltransferase